MTPSLWVGNDLNGKRVHLPLDDFVHGASFGASGLGKSRHLQHLVRQAWRLSLAGTKCATIVIDPHGDLFDDLLCDAYMMGLGSKIVVFDPGPVWSPSLNPVAAKHGDVDVASLVMRAVHKACGDAEDMQTPRLDKHLRNTFRVLQSNDATLLDGFEFLMDPAVRRHLLQQVQDPHVRLMWERFDELTDRNREERIESAENRLDKLVVGSPLMRRVLGVAESSIDIGQIMAEGKTLLVNLGHSHLTHEQRKLLGSLLVETIFETAVRRKRGERSRVLCVVDEAADFLAADEDLPRALAQTRKFGVHFLLAFQQVAQLSEKHAALKAAVLSNCTTRFVFGGSRDDAEILAGELFTGAFHGDEIKHEEHATKFRPVESTRTIRSHAQGTTEAEGHSEGVTDGFGSSSSWGHGSMTGAGDSHGSVMDPEDGLVSQSSGLSANHTMSEFAGGGTMETRSTSRSSSYARSTSDAYSETVVPFMEAHEFRERTSTTFYTPEEQREKRVANLKRQPPRSFHFQCGHHRDAMALRTPDVHPFWVPVPRLERFLQRVFIRTGCMQQASAIDRQLEVRRKSLRPRLEITSSADARPRVDKGSQQPKVVALSPTEQLLAASRRRRDNCA